MRRQVKSATGSCWLWDDGSWVVTGDLLLAAGDCLLTAGDWRLEAGGRS